MGDLTRIFEGAVLADDQRTDLLFSIVYDELRKLAKRKLADEASGQTLQTTALVHEAYLRLVGSDQQWTGRRHFFAAAAEAMRRILVERAREKNRLKRGGKNWHRVRFEEGLPRTEPPSSEVLAIHEALDGLAKEYPAKAELVKLRYFAGFTTNEAADVLGISTRSAERYWAFARVWLLSQLGSNDSTANRR